MADHRSTGQDHYEEARSLLAFVTNFDGQVADTIEAANTIAAANAHATLALVECLHAKFEVRTRGLGKFEVSPK